MEQPTIGIEKDTLILVIKKLIDALEPMTPYRQDPLEFSNLAHEAKNEIIQEVLSLLPQDVVKEARQQ